MFDVFYIGENKKLKEFVPFAEQVDSKEEINTKTKMYWLIEPNVELIDYDILQYRPPEYDQQYEHVWKWDDKNYGGVKLLPKRDSNGIKQVNKVICKKHFDVLHTKTPGKYFDKHPYATNVWCVDPEYKINDRIDWAPDNFEPDFIHSFHLRGQLEHKYPEKEGGIKLYPRNWKSCDIKYHGFLDAAKEYPVIYVNDVNDYSQRDVYDEDYVWLIDKDYQINPDTIDWVPNPFEQNYIHVFKMPFQLNNRYPMSMGGIRLVPKKWKKCEHKIHQNCPFEDISYDVFFVDNDDFDAETYRAYAERSKTEWFWVVDREFTFNGKLLYIPEESEKYYIHVFKIPGHLEYRYEKNIENPSDLRCGGVRLVNKNFDITKQKYQKGIVPVKYDVFYTDSLDNFEKFAEKSRTKMFWVVDSQYRISNHFNYVPYKDEKHLILNFHAGTQLRSKYPEKEGGIYLVPKKYTESTQIKYKGNLGVKGRPYPVLLVDDVDSFENTYKEDCWIVDKQYKTLNNFDWSPGEFQTRSMHVFHVKEQLYHKYPEKMGGVRWVPYNWDGSYVIHDEFIQVDLEKYPYVLTTDLNDFSQLPANHNGAWLIDEEYQIDPETIDWCPDIFEETFLHTFHIQGQLQHKYPEEMGGVRWVPANWTGETKIHQYLPVKNKRYPLYYVEDPNDYSDVVEDCWLVDQEYDITSEIDWVPDDFERGFIHTFHIQGQLGHKYPEEMGGIHWVPANYKEACVKIHLESPFSSSGYPIMFKEDVYDLSDIRNDTWIVDSEYQIEENIDWTPPEFQKDYVHVFHVKGQLSHKYPEAMGGLRWVPTQWNGKYVIHEEPLDIGKKYPILFVNDPTIPPDVDHACWVIDKDYMISDNISWCPSVFEKDKVHVFHVDKQLTTKYPEELGGVYWYPDDKTVEEKVVHLEPLDVQQVFYPIMFVEDPTNFTQANGKECWLVDKEYLLNEDFDFIPWQNQSEKSMIHVYHAANQLLHKYPEEMGGIYWVPIDYENAEIKIHDDDPFEQVLFSVVFTEDLENFAYRDIEAACWIADSEYDVPEHIAWTPPDFQRQFMHVFHIQGQLSHKYPEAMGGLRWVPHDWNGEIVIHDEALETDSKYPIYYVTNPKDYSNVKEDCWLVDKEYQIEDNIKWSPNYFQRKAVHTFHVKGQL